MTVIRKVKVGFRAVVVLVTVMTLYGSVCFNRQMVALHFALHPNSALYYQALALDIPAARLRHFLSAKDWSVTKKLHYLRHESLASEPQAHLLIAKTLYDDGQYDKALQWTNNSSLTGNHESLLLKAQIYLAQRQFSKAKQLLKGHDEPMAKGMLARAHLAFGEFDMALALLESNPSQYALALKRKLDILSGESVKRPDCKLSLQLLASDLDGLEYAAGLIKQWQQKRAFKALPICLLAPKGFDPKGLGCIDEIGQRQSCQLTAMAQRLEMAANVLPVVIHGTQGKANYNNGIIFINRLKSFGVFAHELMHHFGFLDEYALTLDIARGICDRPQAGFVGENLYIVPKGSQGVKLSRDMTEVATCDGTSAQAYKLVKTMTLMEFMDQSLPALYQDKINNKLNHQQQQLANYHYAYALAFERSKEPEQYHFWLKRSAALGYSPAQNLLND